MAHIKIRTKGMHCRSCENIIKELLEELQGVTKAEASHKRELISVDFDPNIIKGREVIEVIKLGGYNIE